MGGRRLDSIATQLLAGGLARDTPVAIVTRATWPDEQVRFLSLGELPQFDCEAMLLPALAIIGDVARQPERVHALASTAAAS